MVAYKEKWMHNRLSVARGCRGGFLWCTKTILQYLCYCIVVKLHNIEVGKGDVAYGVNAEDCCVQVPGHGDAR